MFVSVLDEDVSLMEIGAEMRSIKFAPRCLQARKGHFLLSTDQPAAVRDIGE
jgi:hypothetical protein